jgi:hypothetical protein
MAVSEYERTQLFNWFEEHMGTERATTMMNLLPPVGWGDVATRRDLELLEERLGHQFELVDARFDRLEARLDAKIDSVARQAGSRIDLVDVRLDAMNEKMDGMAATMATKADVIESRTELQRTLVTWIFAAQATVVAAVGLLIAYLG